MEARKPLDNLHEQPAPKPDPASSPAKKARRDEVNEEARVETTEPNTIVGLGEPDKDSEKDEGAASPDEKKERTEEDVSHVAIDTVAEETVVSEVEKHEGEDGATALVRSVFPDIPLDDAFNPAGIADCNTADKAKNFAVLGAVEMLGGADKIKLINATLSHFETLSVEQRNNIDDGYLEAYDSAMPKMREIDGTIAKNDDEFSQTISRLQSLDAKRKELKKKRDKIYGVYEKILYSYLRLAQKNVDLDDLKLKDDANEALAADIATKRAHIAQLQAAQATAERAARAAAQRRHDELVQRAHARAVEEAELRALEAMLARA